MTQSTTFVSTAGKKSLPVAGQKPIDIDAELLKLGEPVGLAYIQMVKKHRELTGSSFKDAADYCRALREKLGG